MKKIDLRRRLIHKQRNRILKFIFLGILGFIIISLLFNLAVRLPVNSAQPVDAIFVLGGSIRREIYAAQLANQNPELPILISQGSKEPCIWEIFENAGGRLNNVWLEKCANSTFDNFFFGVPILRQWGVHKVKLITSTTHLPRAKWMADILLGAQGIAVEVDTPRETGIPGNQEFALKTGLDITRSLIWAFFSQIIQPPCFDVIELAKIDLQNWQKQGYSCERHIN
jgi:uncharacterized SAM-binding protein YcdF (DUF218 family)